MRRVGPLSPRFEKLMPDRLVRAVAVHGVVLLMPGLLGPGRVPAARGRAVALRVEPLAKAQRLAPVGRPPLTHNTVRPAVPAWMTTATRSRARGSQA